jgi:hypothetical protein
MGNKLKKDIYIKTHIISEGELEDDSESELGV